MCNLIIILINSNLKFIFIEKQGDDKWLLYAQRTEKRKGGQRIVLSG